MSKKSRITIETPGYTTTFDTQSFSIEGADLVITMSPIQDAAREGHPMPQVDAVECPRSLYRAPSTDFVTETMFGIETVLAKLGPDEALERNQMSTFKTATAILLLQKINLTLKPYMALHARILNLIQNYEAPLVQDASLEAHPRLTFESTERNHDELWGLFEILQGNGESPELHAYRKELFSYAHRGA